MFLFKMDFSTFSLISDVTPGGSSASGVCAVPNCSANCGGGRPPTASLIRAASNNANGTETVAFNSSCQQCIAERAAVGSSSNVTTVPK